MLISVKNERCAKREEAKYFIFKLWCKREKKNVFSTSPRPLVLRWRNRLLLFIDFDLIPSTPCDRFGWTHKFPAIFYANFPNRVYCIFPFNWIKLSICPLSGPQLLIGQCMVVGMENCVCVCVWVRSLFGKCSPPSVNVGLIEHPTHIFVDFAINFHFMYDVKQWFIIRSCRCACVCVSAQCSNTISISSFACHRSSYAVRKNIDII
jgi:hypothetical protein